MIEWVPPQTPSEMSEEQPVSFPQSGNAAVGGGDTLSKIRNIARVLDEEYARSPAHPWVVAYSGGKDSTLVLQMAIEAAQRAGGENPRPIRVVSNDTLVESPLVIDHLKRSLAKIRQFAGGSGLSLSAVLTRPCVDDTFWVNLIGKGYIQPTRNFRWCTDRMKISPANRLIEDIAYDHGGAILLLGTRKSESTHRRRNIERRNGAARMNPHDSIPECSVFAPIAELTDEEVWSVLLQSRPPWGGTHRELVTLYRNAQGGECPMVMSTEDAPSCGSTSPRFGCWTCTVVNKDRSLAGLVDSGFEEFEPLMNFRERLLELRENKENRMTIRRDGFVRFRADGSRVYGPFKVKVRKQILSELLELQREVGRELITEDELTFIHEFWREDEIRDKMNAMSLVGLDIPQAA